MNELICRLIRAIRDRKGGHEELLDRKIRDLYPGVVERILIERAGADGSSGPGPSEQPNAPLETGQSFPPADDQADQAVENSPLDIQSNDTQGNDTQPNGIQSNDAQPTEAQPGGPLERDRLRAIRVSHASAYSQ